MTNEQLKKLKEINRKYKINSKNALSKERTDLVDIAIKEIEYSAIIRCSRCNTELCHFCKSIHNCCD